MVGGFACFIYISWFSFCGLLVALMSICFCFILLPYNLLKQWSFCCLEHMVTCMNPMATCLHHFLFFSLSLLPRVLFLLSVHSFRYLECLLGLLFLFLILVDISHAWLRTELRYKLREQKLFIFRFCDWKPWLSSLPAQIAG